MNMHARYCRCGPPRQLAATRVHAQDARSAARRLRSDPTGTTPLQRQFQRALRQRWQALRAMIPDAVAHSAHRINAIQIASITGQDPIVAFQHWLDEALRQVVLGTNGSWTLQYVRQAGDRGTLRASTLQMVQDGGDWDESEHPRDKAGKFTEGDGESFVDNFDLPEDIRENISLSLNHVKGRTVEIVNIQVDKGTRGKGLGSKAMTALTEAADSAGIRLILSAAEDADGSNGGLAYDDLVGWYEKFGFEMGGGGSSRMVRMPTTKLKDAAPTVIVVDRIPTMQSLTITELQGICEAVSQRAVRAYAEGALRRQTPSQIGRNIQQVIESIGRKRGDLLVSFMIVRAFGAATLDAFRSRGITHISILPERVTTPPVITDAKAKIKAKAKPKKKSKAKTKNLIEVLTAGDDDVCPTCEEISENGPYTLDEAEALIPAHPRCRCAFVPWDDNRFADVHDAPPLADARTHIAAGVMFLDPVGKALFLKRSNKGDHAGEWCFPGGAVEAGETLQSAAKRETLEETGHMAVDLEEIDRREFDGVDFTTYASHVPFIFEPKLNREHDAWLWAPLSNPPQPLHPGVRATVNRAMVGDEFNEKDHPRHPKGHPDGGKFASKVESAFDPEPTPIATPALNMDTLAKIGGKKGSNEGGVYTNKDGGDQYYIKTPKTKDHVQNELTAAALYKAAGVNTMEYVPVEGGAHVATKLVALDKDNIAKFTADEHHEAQKDFAIHAWLANWDAAGTGGDNQVVVNGKVATVDTGGSLKYRAQGEPKGAAFGDKVTEFESLRDSSKSPDAAALYGNMTPKQLVESIDRVKAIPDGDIVKAVIKNGGTMSLANQLIARKDDLASKSIDLARRRRN